MRSAYFCSAAFAASLLQFAVAQDSVPTDLAANFNLEVQAAFEGEANEGFKDGASFSKDEVAEEPSFALGDSDGIAPSVLYTIILVDTSDDNARTLHYARANFKHSEGVKLESEDQPLMEYKAPGTLGETGDERKYTFLLYTNPQRRNIDSLTMPGDGETFDVKKFQDDNGLEDPSAGIGMVVSLNGEASPEPSASSEPTATAGPSSTAAQSIAPPSSAAAPTSEAESNTATSVALPTSEAESEAATSAASSASESESQAASAVPIPTGGSQNETAPSATGATTGLAPASPTPSTVALSSVAPDATEAPTASASNAPAEQTGSGGAMLSLPWAQCVVLAPVVVFAGLMV